MDKKRIEIIFPKEENDKEIEYIMLKKEGIYLIGYIRKYSKKIKRRVFLDNLIKAKVCKTCRYRLQTEIIKQDIIIKLNLIWEDFKEKILKELIILKENQEDKYKQEDKDKQERELTKIRNYLIIERIDRNNNKRIYLKEKGKEIEVDITDIKFNKEISLLELIYFDIIEADILELNKIYIVEKPFRSKLDILNKNKKFTNCTIRTNYLDFIHEFKKRKKEINNYKLDNDLKRHLYNNIYNLRIISGLNIRLRNIRKEFLEEIDKINKESYLLRDEICTDVLKTPLSEYSQIIYNCKLGKYIQDNDLEYRTEIKFGNNKKEVKLEVKNNKIKIKSLILEIEIENFGLFININKNTKNLKLLYKNVKNNKLYPLLIGNVSINGNICLGNYRYNHIEEEIIELNEYENLFFNRLYTIEDLFIYKKLKEYPLDSIYLKKDINDLNFNLINFNMKDQNDFFLYDIKSYKRLQKEEYRIIKTDNKFLEKIEIFLE